MVSTVRRPVKLLALSLLTLVSGVPVLAGLGMTLLKALNPAAWSVVLSTPGIWSSLALSLWTGAVSTVTALLIAHLTVALAGPAQWTGRLRAAILPLLALPHLAVGIGLALLLAPSGLIVRLLSPWLTGFAQPPDWMTIQDPFGLSLIIGLVTKETPFLALMLLGALTQVPSEPLMLASRTLGYGRLKAWLVSVAPALQRQIRLPIAAVFVYGATNVDMAIPLGSQTPQPLSIVLWQWYTNSRLDLQDAAYAGSIMLLGATLLGLISLAGAGRAGAALLRRVATSGRRAATDRALRTAFSSLPLAVAVLGGGALLALALRAASQMWRFPRVLPEHLGWKAFGDAAPAATPSLTMTLTIAALVAIAAVALTLAVVELLADKPRWTRAVGLWLFLPLVVPQLAFLFGLAWLTTRLRLEGTLLAVIWTHLLFALPYTWGILATARAALDPRFQLAARVLGAAPLRAWWTVTAPLLTRSALLAASLAFAVSAALYLPTLFTGAGRIVTIATEAASAAASGALHIAALYGALQAALPLLAFAVTSTAAHIVYRRFGGVPR